jgi:hypothetical protein
VQDPDDTRHVEPSPECHECRAELSGAAELADGWAQVWDILPVALEKVHHVLLRRKCGCRAVTTATPRSGQAGAVCYGPNLNAAVLLGSQGNVPVERTAMLMHALFGVEVSTGFVARAAARLADRLNTAGFDEAMKAALRAEDVLCAVNERPVNVLHTTCGARQVIAADQVAYRYSLAMPPRTRVRNRLRGSN